MLSKIIKNINNFFNFNVEPSTLKYDLGLDKMKKLENSLKEYRWLDAYKERVFLDYIEDKARELADKENIKIFSVLFDDLNKDETIDSDKAVGIFRYYKDKEIMFKYKILESHYKNLNKQIPTEQIFPRIEISEKGDVFTLLHELGHYFIYKREQEQSEALANLFIVEFFDNYLPPFFKWIYQIEIKIRGKIDFSYTLEESKEHWEEYCKFKNEYEKIFKTRLESYA